MRSWQLAVVVANSCITYSQWYPDQANAYEKTREIQKKTPSAKRVRTAHRMLREEQRGLGQHTAPPNHAIRTVILVTFDVFIVQQNANFG